MLKPNSTTGETMTNLISKGIAIALIAFGANFANVLEVAAAPPKCILWDISGTWYARLANGDIVKFDIFQLPNGAIKGNGRHRDKIGPAEGVIGDGEFELSVSWADHEVERYQGGLTNYGEVIGGFVSQPSASETSSPWYVVEGPAGTMAACLSFDTAENHGLSANGEAMPSVGPKRYSIGKTRLINTDWNRRPFVGRKPID